MRQLPSPRLPAAVLLLPILAGPALPPAPAPEAEQEVRLRLKTEEGETTTYRYRTKVAVTPPPGMGAATNVTSTMVVRRTTESVTDDSLRFRVRVEDFELDFASQDERARTQLEDAAESARRDAVGSRFWLTVTPAGEILRLRREGGEAVQGQGVEQSLRQLSFATLPAGPVAVGESWSASDSLDAASYGAPIQGTIVTDTRSTLESVDTSDGGPIAVLRVEGDYELLQDAQAGGSLSGELQGSSVRTARFDVEAGRFLDTEGSEDVTVNLSMPGAGDGSLAVQTSIRHSARLVEGG